MSWIKKLARRIVAEGSCYSDAAATCCPRTYPGEVIKEAVKKNYAELITQQRAPAAAALPGPLNNWQATLTRHPNGPG